MIPCRESDGLGASLMSVVCAWCQKDLGAKVCEPAMAGKVSHGICPACTEQTLGAYSKAPVIEVASRPARFPPSGENGTAGQHAHAADEHARACPATSTFSEHRPLFWTVQGSDFGRSIAWAKRVGNDFARQIRDIKQRRDLS